jgi:hypothetical protein
MKNHQAVIDMRRQGSKPTMVFLTDYPEADGKWSKQDDYIDINVFHDVPERADLRFLIGLSVTITASSKDRAKAFFEACVAAGANTVSTCYYPNDKENYFRLYTKDGFDKTTEDKHRYES